MKFPEGLADGRAKGAQRGVARRGNQRARLNFGNGLRASAGTRRQERAYARRAGRGAR